MVKLLRKFLVTVLSVLLAGTSVVAISTPAQALKGSDFDPGLIISDSVFFDFGTMNAASVQRFLESQVSKCTDNDGGPKCLRNYTEDIIGSEGIKDLIKATWEYGMCKKIDAAKDQTAAAIIVKVARACSINPRVLLVMLQKEQGLVQSPDPTTYMYKAAMGYGCPDSKPEICGKDSIATSRLFSQLYRAAWQLRWYGDPRGSFTWLKPGKNVSVLYHPSGKSACGAKTFLMQNQATANLYYYTPYTPNAAALKNLWGTGDSCSAYGNRNFWRFYWSWFGSPIGGGFLLKSSSSDTYLIVRDANQVDKKYKLADKSLIDHFAPLGPLGVISQTYLDSFSDGGTIGRLVKSDTTYYYVDGGNKYAFTSCTHAKNWGFDCASAIALTDVQLDALATGDRMTLWMREDPTDPASQLYYVSNGVKRSVLNPEAITAAGIALPTRYAPVGIDRFANLPWGTPIAPENTLFTNAKTKQQGLIHLGKYYEIDSATTNEVRFSPWFTSSTNTLDGNSLAAIDSGIEIKTIVKDPTGKEFILTSSGKRAVDEPTDLGVVAPQVPATLLDRIPNVGEALATPSLVRVSGSKSIYWLANGQRRLTDTSTTRAKLVSAAVNTEIQNLPKSAMQAIPLGGPIFSPGLLVKDAKSRLYLVDGTSKLIRVPSGDQAKLYGLGTAVSKTKSTDLAGYLRQGNLAGLKVQCDAQIYLPVAGTLQPIAADYAAHYPGSIQQLDALTCANLNVGTTQLGRFVKSPSKLIYLMQDGKRRLINTTTGVAQYYMLRGDTPPLFKINLTTALLLPIGKNVSSAAKTPIPLASGATATPSPTPTATPKPTATSTPAPTTTAAPAARPNPCTPSSFAYLNTTRTNWYHRVVSGETLGGIATKCGTTVTRLKTWNSITDVNNIQIGQKIRVSNY